MSPQYLQSFSRDSCSDPTAQASCEVYPSLTKLFPYLWLSSLGLSGCQWAAMGGRKSPGKRAVPGEEDRAFLHNPGDVGIAKGTAVGGSTWMILPWAQRPCFHLLVGGGGHSKLEVHFLCRNANSRAKQWDRTICCSTKPRVFHSQHLLLLSPQPCLPITAAF